MTMKFPRFTREERLCCKLSDEEINNVREDYKTGLYSLRELGRKYKVSSSTILYWVNEKTRQYMINREKKRTKYNPNLRKRRKIIKPEYIEYLREIEKNRIRPNKKESMRKSYYKHRQKRMKERKEYYIKNKEEKLRKDKEYRIRNKKKISERRKARYALLKVQKSI